MRYFIELAYLGKAYHGWQNQPNAITVQQVLENALSTLLKSPLQIVGAGRTDAGVHAKKMFAHFEFDSPLEVNLVYKLNQFLPNDISIYNIHNVTEEAHARFDAKSRTYHYYISEKKNPFVADSAYLLKTQIDINKMNQAAGKLLNYKNFKCFSRSNTDVKTYHCKVVEAIWFRDDHQLIFKITADRFLRNMVRAIVGTLIEIGNGKRPVEAIDTIIQSQDRSQAGPSAPAHGLFLTEITYPEDIFINDRS